jgi:hypothetical protein
MKEILWFDMTRQCCLMSKIQLFLQVKQPKQRKRWVLWQAQQREESKLSDRF